jgi:hypothetical protein
MLVRSSMLVPRAITVHSRGRDLMEANYNWTETTKLEQQVHRPGGGGGG